jgi:hypothetical protein
MLAILGALLALTGCGKSFDWNQKVTVEVQTPEGIKSAASVQHIEWACCGPIKAMDGPSASSKVVGEAVVVDLGGKYLFALLRGDGTSFAGAADSIASFALWGPRKALGTEEGLRYMTSLPYGTSAVLQPGNLPLLVTFTDVNNPETVKLVNPANLAASFGQGYALKSISVEITHEKVSEGEIEKVLGWIKTFEGPGLCPPTFQPIDESPFCSLRGLRDFRRNEK